MTGLEWYGAPLRPNGRAPRGRWWAGRPTSAAFELADAQNFARRRGDFTGEWLADFTPEARAALDTRLEAAAAAIEESGEAVGARVAQSRVPAKE